MCDLSRPDRTRRRAASAPRVHHLSVRLARLRVQRWKMAVLFEARKFNADSQVHDKLLRCAALHCMHTRYRRCSGPTRMIRKNLISKARLFFSNKAIRSCMIHVGAWAQTAGRLVQRTGAFCLGLACMKKDAPCRFQLTSRLSLFFGAGVQKLPLTLIIILSVLDWLPVEQSYYFSQSFPSDNENKKAPSVN